MRCPVCGNLGCPVCDAQNASQAPLVNIFDSPAIPDPESPLAANTGRESVWVSSRLSYFRAKAGAWPSTIGFSGLAFPPDGAYRVLDLIWLAWLNVRVERLDGFAKSDGRSRLREIVTEALNAGSLPAAFDNPQQWPRIVPADYEPPTLENFSKILPAALD